MTKVWVAIFLLFSAMSCGEKPGPQIPIDIMPSSALLDSNVSDIVFSITNIPDANGDGLDQDGDGHPDAFYFPTVCGSTFPAGCGFPRVSGSKITVGEIPLGFRYRMIVRLRNAAGTALYSGTLDFDNDQNLGSILVTVTVPTP